MASMQAEIEWIARFDGIEKQIAEAKAIGDKTSQALLGSLLKELKAAKKATDELAKAAKDSAKGVGSLGDAAGKAGAASAKLRGILGMISPDLAALAGGVNDASDAMEVGAQAGQGLGLSATAVAGAFAVAATAAAGAYVAYKIYTEESDRAAQIAASVAQAHQAIAPILNAERDALIDVRVATGELSEEQARNVQIQLSAMDTLAQATAGTRARIAEIRADQADLTTGLVDGLMEQGKSWGWLGAIQTSVFDALTTDSSELQEEIDALTGEIRKAETATVGTVKAQRQASEATDRHRGSASALKDTLASLNAEMDAGNNLAEKNAQAYASSIAALDGAREADERAMLSAEERAAAEHTAALATLKAEKDKALVVASGLSAREEAERAYRAAAAAENDRYNAEVAKSWTDSINTINAETQAAGAEMAAFLADQQAAVRDMAVGIASQTLDTVGSIATTVQQNQTSAVEELQARLEESGDKMSAGEKKRLQAQIKEHQQSAMKAFRVSQAASIGQALMTTGQAAISGLAAGLALGPPGLVIGPAAAASALAYGAAQVAQIASTPAPSFNDTPALMRMQGGGNVHLASGDYFAAAKRPEDLRAQVGASGPSEVTIKHSHRYYSATVAEDLRTRGPLRRALGTAAGRVGHRRRSSK